MNHLTIDFEDAQHLRSQVGHLHDLLSTDPPAALNGRDEGLALWDTDELRDELQRRTLTLPANDPIQPEKEKGKPGRKPKEKPAAAPAATATEPEPDAAALPSAAQDVNRESGSVASDIPSSEEMEALLARYFAAASLDALRQVVFEVTGAKTLKAAPKEKWPALKARLEHELVVGVK